MPEGADEGFTNPVKRLGIPRILLADDPHGVRVEKGSNSDGEEPYMMTGEMLETAAFPCEAAMASTWNKDPLYSCSGEPASLQYPQPGFLRTDICRKCQTGLTFTDIKLTAGKLLYRELLKIFSAK